MVRATADAARRTTSRSKAISDRSARCTGTASIFTLNARLRQGLILQFGTTTGRSVEDTCEMAQVLDSTAAPAL